MQRLNFTSQVLGPGATKQLKRKEVTQTIRSPQSDIVKALHAGELAWGSKGADLIEVALDGKLLGNAYISFIDEVQWDDLDLNDAARGGFDTRFALAYALRRAGYRFQELNSYNLYRIQFQWQN